MKISQGASINHPDELGCFALDSVAWQSTLTVPLFDQFMERIMPGEDWRKT